VPVLYGIIIEYYPIKVWHSFIEDRSAAYLYWTWGVTLIDYIDDYEGQTNHETM